MSYARSLHVVARQFNVAPTTRIEQRSPRGGVNRKHFYRLSAPRVLPNTVAPMVRPPVVTIGGAQSAAGFQWAASAVNYTTCHQRIAWSVARLGGHSPAVVPSNPTRGTRGTGGNNRGRIPTTRSRRPSCTWM